MRFKWAFAFMTFFISTLAVASGRVTAGYLGAEYENSFKDTEYSLNGEIGGGRDKKYTFFLGYANAHRTYQGGATLDKNSIFLGSSYKFLEKKMYLEAALALSDTDLIGAKSVYSVMPHTTAFKDFDVGLGVDYAIYSTGNITTIKPQILYFISDSWMLGHTSWFFNADGNHYAWRNYLRGSVLSWKADVGVAGGDAREDIGVIDQFFSYSLGVSRVFAPATIGISAERYEGKLRRGWQWGASGSWQF